MRNFEYAKKYSFFLSFWQTSKLKHPKNFFSQGFAFSIDFN
ncbi:hypothetical protein LEP1GSC082_1302 [Leptospira kirschneri str. H2]|nr:hypothetical protein LEP1GSC082_1302 [Leptospira kirschneri str. H2]